MLVGDLPQDQLLALENLHGDIVELYKSLAEVYVESWPTTVTEVVNVEGFEDSVAKVQEGCKAIGLSKVSRYSHVEPDYYDWPLRQRALRVLAPSEAHMCKSVVMVNQGYSDQFGLSDDVYPKYICVLTQYIAPVNTNKLTAYFRSLIEKPPGKKFYNFRLAKAEVSFELTGFHTGGVCPIGMNTPIPVVLAESITKLEPPVMCMGAGHIDWKLSLPVKDFIDATRCLIIDLE
ncbi:YbaK/aminoacyl-tRNA synthetase-associated domain-containing protein [Dichotomocladium elegans]|nr:YbaK/aminoacyl-tRNA synthetase-associated domain-containing protein [Dichotomocladium elegans]